MTKKRLIIALALFAFMGADVCAQGFLNRLKDKRDKETDVGGNRQG